MERLDLIIKEKGTKSFSRQTAKLALENVIKRINEVNQKEEFIYKITKAVLFGSYINSSKEKIGDLDIALYVELKDDTIPEIDQNVARAKTSSGYVPFILRFIYGKEEVFKYIKNKKRILQLHDGIKVDEDAKKCNEPISYIFFDKNVVIYEEV